MIDEDAVMADNSRASSNDDDFDPSKKDARVCNFACMLLKATSTGKTTKSD